MFVVAVLMLVMGCAVSGPMQDRKVDIYQNPTYLNASTENKGYIEKNEIAKGMTLDECKLSWKERHFELVTATSLAQLYKVYEPTGMMYLYFVGGTLAYYWGTVQ